MRSRQIARVVHEANRALQIEQNDPAIPVSPSWDEAGSEMQASAIMGVRGVIEGNTPRESHESWLKFKQENGWTYGPVKDEETKQHPCFVAYDDLPESQKLKDDLFVAIVKALL